MKVLTLQVRNIQSVKEIDLNLTGRALYLIGGHNEAGKTSVLKSLLMALCGRKGLDQWPDCPIREGEQEASVRVTLSGDDELQDNVGFTAELLFMRTRTGIVEKFRLLDSTGEEAPEPRTLLSKLYGLRAFDPTAFDRMDRKGKKEVLQRMVDGLDFTEQEAKHAKLFAERTDVNREIKKLGAIVNAMQVYPTAPKEPVVVAELLTELQRRQAVNKGNEERRRFVADAVRAERVAYTKIIDCEQEVRKLEEQLAAAKGRVLMAQEAHKSAVTLRQTEEAAAAGLVDADVDEVATQLKGAEAVNAKVQANKLHAAKTRELDKLRATAQSLTDAMDAIREAEQKAMQEAKWPVPGLGFDAEGVTYEGRPIEQASASRRFRIGAMIGMKLNSKLRLLVCEHGSDLDRDTLEELDKILHENDYQALVEIATRTPADDAMCQVVLEGGEIKLPEGDANARPAANPGGPKPD